MGFASKLSIHQNVATSLRDDGEYTIKLSIERKDGKPITVREAEIALTNNVRFMYNERRAY